MKSTMSAQLPLPDRAASGRSQTRTTLPHWLREPLLHFVVVGGVLFGMDQWLVSRTDDPLTLVMDAAADKEARGLFQASRGRPPSPEELKALRGVWLDNEVLYREGVALGVDKGDTAIRERVIFKALSVVDASVKLPPYDDRTLRGWFDSHRAKYDEPARYSFQEAALAGDISEASVAAFVESLNAGTPGDNQAGLRVFKARPRGNLVQSYGPEFATSLDQSPIGKWRALNTRDGWRAILPVAITPPNPGNYDQLRGVVLQDWTDATLAEQRSAAVRALAKKYTVRFEGTAK